MTIFFGIIACMTTQETIKRESYKAPEWAEGIVWYQIFPERFRDGDSTNQPKRNRARGPENWNITSWTQDWYKRDSWEIKQSGDFYETVRQRRYGGDLQGVIDQLDYLRKLGIGALYFNPVFDAPSMHKYDASYYHHIDRNFGPDPEGDIALFKSEDPGDPNTWKWSSADSLFLKLIEEAHHRDMKIIIDGVWNHTGTEFWAFRDLLEKQRGSEYKNWYIVTSYDEPTTPDTNEFDYEGWWGYKGMPVFQEKDGNFVKPLQEHIFAVTRRWMDPNGDGDPSDGIDGWRLDVADEIGKKWWREWHHLVREINPNAITIAEIWTDKAKEFITPAMFTSVMNYRFAYATKDFLIDDKISSTEFVQRLQQIEEDYPAGAANVLQNLMDSHDVPRLASMIVNPGREYDRNGHPKDGFQVRKPNSVERQIQKLVALFQFSWKGAPMIYYGTEAGMWGADDPDDRKPMVWDDLDYKHETHHPYGKRRPVDDNNFDAELHDYYQKLAVLRNNEPLLKTGNAEIVYHHAGKKLLVFNRTLKEDKIWVVINRGEHQQSIDLSQWIEKQHLKNLLNSKIYPASNLPVMPISGLMLK